MNTIIKLNNIGKYYLNGTVKTPVFEDFSWTFDEGCFTVLAGPSGSGKSSLLNIMATLDSPCSGAYYLNDKLVDFNKKNELSGIRKNNFGFVFQSFNLIPVLTALENVELPLTLFDYSALERADMAKTALALVGLENKLGNKPSQMSGGEQQRVAMARAIARKPRIIFADEPTANLDRVNAISIIDLMQKLNTDTGISFIIASHDDKVIATGKDIIKIGQ